MSVLPNPCIVVILAGGKATRYGGQDKGEILIRGERLIDIIHNRLLPQSSEIIISGTHDYDLGLTVVPDIEDAPGGPVGGLYSIWSYLKSRDVDGFFTAAIDGPKLPSDLTAKLYDEAASTIAADEQGQHPTYAWWRMEDLSDLWPRLDMQNSLSLKSLIDLTKAEYVEWDCSEIFVNINRPEDLKNYVK